MHKSDGRADPVGIVAPSRARALTAAADLKRRMPDARWRFLSLPDLLVRGKIAQSLVLCPAGADAEADIVFLSRVSARALWPAPEADLHGAISGLLGHHLSVSSAPIPRKRSNRKIALLIEGEITMSRARAALRSDTREWIVEKPASVRLSERQLKRYQQLGVRWTALEPVRVLGLFASPRLAAVRRRWKRLLPPDTPVWIWRE
jgi:hypothetical protein